MALWHYATLCTAAQAPQSLLMYVRKLLFSSGIDRLGTYNP